MLTMTPARKSTSFVREKSETLVELLFLMRRDTEDQVFGTQFNSGRLIEFFYSDGPAEICD